MSDLGRKGFGEQAKEKMTPDSSKSTTEKASENISGMGDKLASTVQGDSNKSGTQQAGDAMRGKGSSAESEGKSYLQSAQETVGNMAQSVQDTLSGNTGKK